MQFFGFQIVINCALAEVFAIYTDIERWRNRSVFGDIRWVQGTPWEEGSRLRIETRVPVPSVVDQVVQHFEANRSVSYLSHVFGITCETRVVEGIPDHRDLFLSREEQQANKSIMICCSGSKSSTLVLDI